MAKKSKLIVIAGPTAVGKTELSIELAKRTGGEVISADSIQVYKGLDIGSAKIRPDEMQGVRHHLIDILDPKEPFDVALFQKLAKEAVSDIEKRGKVPIVTGGTGFYVHALIYDNDFSDGASDPEYRAGLEEKAKDPGNDLYERLKEVDPDSALAIPKGNMKRVIRALEYYHVTGTKISEHNRIEREKETPYDLKFFVLTMPRDKLYERIDLRVERMVSEGLFNETEELLKAGVKPEMTSMQGLGYKQACLFFEGKYSKEEAIDAIKKETRHFAKRQLTWFKKEKEAVFIDRTDLGPDEDIVDLMISRAGIG